MNLRATLKRSSGFVSPCLSSGYDRISRMGCLCLLTTGLAATLAGCGSGISTSSTSASQTVVIVKQPASVNIPIGRPAQFSVEATGAIPLSYQWSRDGVRITGATGSTYATANVTSADSGATFQVIVTDANGSMTSQAATLTAMARAPQPGDLRLLPRQMVAVSELNAGISTNILASKYSGQEYDIANAIGTPLSLGSNGQCTAGSVDSCTWLVSWLELIPGKTGISTGYRASVGSAFISDLQTIVADNVVVNSVDIEPTTNLYALSWETTTSAGRFDFRREVIDSSQLQATVEQDGQQSRIVTAATFDELGQVTLFSYGWSGDPATVYESKAAVYAADKVQDAVTSLAAQGYTISAFGGNDTNSYIVVGSRVKGDSLPRTIQTTIQASNTPSTTTMIGQQAAANFSTVVHLWVDSKKESLIIQEQ